MTKEEKIDQEIQRMAREQDWCGPQAAILEARMRAALAFVYRDDGPLTAQVREILRPTR